MSKKNANPHLASGRAETTPIQSKHSKSSHTVPKSRSNEETKRLIEKKDSHKGDLTQVTPNKNPENMTNRKRKQSVDCELPCKINRGYKETPFIDIASDDSDPDGNSDDDTHSTNSNCDTESTNSDGDTDSTDSDDNTHSTNSRTSIFVVQVANTLFLKEFTEKISMEDFKRMYTELKKIFRTHNISRTDDVIIFSRKKRSKLKHRKKKTKRHKDLKKPFTKTTDKANLPNVTEVKIERVEETENVKTPPVWLESPSSPVDNLNIVSEAVQFSHVKEEIVTSHCNIEAPSIENVDSIGSCNSMRRYEEEMDNGDLENYPFFEDTTDLEVPSSEKLNSNTQTVNHLTGTMINSADVEQLIKYEPEFNISDDEESTNRLSNNTSNDPVETVKREPDEVNPKITNCELDSLALNVDATTKITSIDSETAVIKHEPVEQEPKPDDSDDNVITVSDDEENDKKSITEVEKKIKHEQIEDHNEGILAAIDDSSKDTEIWNNSDDELEYHENQRIKILEEIRKLSSVGEIKQENDKENCEKDSPDSPVSPKVPLLTDDEIKHEIDEERSKSDEKTDKKTALKDLNLKRTTEDNSGEKQQSTYSKNCNGKESRNKTKSREVARSHDDKKANDEKKSCDRKRIQETHDKETASVKKKCIDKSQCKKSSQEKVSHDEKKIQGEKKLKERKSSNEQRFKDYKRSQDQKKKSNDEERSHRVKKELLNRVAKSEDEGSNKIQHKDESNKQVENRRHSSEMKSAGSDSNNHNSNKNLNHAEKPDPQSVPTRIPFVVLTKIDDTRRSPPLESPIVGTDVRDVKNMDKSSDKQETPTSSIASLENSSRESPLTKEPTNSASTSTQSNDLTVKSETETKHGAKETVDKEKKTICLDREAFQELVKQVTIKEAKKIAEKLFTAKVEFKLTVDAGDNFRLEDQEDQIAKLIESQRMSITEGQCEGRGNEGVLNEGKKLKDKSVDLEKENAVSSQTSPASPNKALKLKTERIRNSDVDGKESFTDGKNSPTNRNSLGTREKTETRKTLDLKETLRKPGTSADGVANSSFNIDAKPVASFKIPKKSATQSNENLAGRSPISEPSPTQQILNTDATILMETRKSKVSRAPRRLEVDTKIGTNLEQFLQRIFQWNPAWLKRKPYVNATQKVVDEENLGPMRQMYETYEDYYMDAERLLALDVWHGMTKEREIESMNGKHCVEFSIVGRSINSKKFPSTNIEMTTLLLDVVVSKRAALIQEHPVVGDLVFFEYLARRQGFECIPTEVFAYVTNVRSNIISSSTRFNHDLLKSVQDPHTLLTYTVLTKPIHHSEIQTGNVYQMTTVPYFRPNIRGILALQQLSESPLLNMIIHPKVEDYQLEPVNLDNYPFVTEDTMNAKQKEAVARITETVVKKVPKISLIQGPPGTGKTKVIANIVTQIIYGGNRFNPRLPLRIVVCAPSNAAADEIVTRLLELRRKFDKGQRFKLVRVGRRDMMHQNVQEVSLTDLTDKELYRFIQTCRNNTPDKIEIIKDFHEGQITRLEEARTNSTNIDVKKNIARKIDDIRTKYYFVSNARSTDQLDRRELDGLRRATENTILEGAHVIVGTPVSCCTNYMEAIFGHDESNPISVCIIDEATKTSEADTLLPLLLGVKSLVLVGDALQQPVDNLHNKITLCGLSQSLFARLQKAFVGQQEDINPTIRFDTQYRMSHPVAYWPKEYFYADSLYSVANLSPLPLHSYKVMNLDSVQDDDAKSVTSNWREALFTACIVYTIATRARLEVLKAPIRVGVITPYHKQKELIKAKIQNRLERLPAMMTQRIICDVNTIDGIQGQERDVIIMSCVRTNGIGILTERQRVWLALTRAKQSMMLCGNFQTFQSDPMWNDLLSDAKFRGAYANVRWDATADEVKTHIVR